MRAKPAQIHQKAGLELNNSTGGRSGPGGCQAPVDAVPAAARWAAKALGFKPGAREEKLRQ